MEMRNIQKAYCNGFKVTYIGLSFPTYLAKMRKAKIRQTFRIMQQVCELFIFHL